MFVICVHGQLMGASVSEQYGGAAATFFSTILLIEEIAKVDMSVSVMVDVQNTLVTPVLEEHGTDEQKHKFLPRLCSDMVGFVCNRSDRVCQTLMVVGFYLHPSSHMF